MAEEKYRGLSNLDLVTVYYTVKAKVERIDDQLNQGRMVIIKPPKSMGKVDTPEKQMEALMMKAKVKTLSDYDVQQYRDSEYYKSLYSVLKTLEPVVEIIESSDDSVINVLHKIKQ